MELENLNETINWLDGYIDAIIENDLIKKEQIEKMITRLVNDLNLTNFFEYEDLDDLPF